MDTNDPWASYQQEEEDDYRPTVVDGPGGGAPPPAAPGGGGSFQPTYPMQNPTPPYGSPAQNYPSPPPAQPQQGYPSPPPQPAGGYPQQMPQQQPPQQQPQQQQRGGSQTMIMPTGPEKIIPLAWLAIVEGPGGKRGQVFSLKSENVIGRATGSIVLSQDQAVSSRHLRIKLEISEEDPDQQVFVMYDQGSSNGTYVGDYETCQDDDEKIYRHVLQDGDYVRVGETIFIFKQA